MGSMDDGILGRAFAVRLRGGRTRDALTPFYHAGILFFFLRERERHDGGNVHGCGN